MKAYQLTNEMRKAGLKRPITICDQEDCEVYFECGEDSVNVNGYVQFLVKNVEVAIEFDFYGKIEYDSYGEIPYIGRMAGEKSFDTEGQIEHESTPYYFAFPNVNLSQKEKEYMLKLFNTRMSKLLDEYQDGDFENDLYEAKKNCREYC